MHWSRYAPALKAKTVANMRAKLPSGKAPTTRVCLRIFRFRRSMALSVCMHLQCSRGNFVKARVST